ncbi:MAG: exonuclease domain-containing protein [Nitrospira sp.]|nr:exonuclease domain-containing protein [Nitrospira sp.]
MSISTPRLVVIDCETTGVGQHDRIVEIAALTLDPQTWEPMDEYDTLINPERDVGPVGVHGITASMVEAAPTFPEVAAALTHRLHGAILIAHNLPFDTRMLGYEFKRLGVAFNVGSGLCTFRATGEKLVAACYRFGIALNVQHRALADARATAALAREVLAGDEIDPRPATLGDVSQLLNVRTLRRESSDARISELARVVSLTHYPCADEVLLQYLDALDWALDDCHIDDQERAAIEDLASTLGISAEQRHQAHRSYLSSIIAAAERDGIVTETENQLIRKIAEVLGIVDVIVPQVTQLPAASSLRNGMRVCFTGNAVVEGASVSRSSLEETAALIGMQPVGSVTKRGCDLLVAADSSSQSGKARKAREYGIPMMTVEDFLNEAGKDVV